MTEQRPRPVRGQAPGLTPLASYLRAMRSHPLVVLAVVAATVGGAGSLLVTRAAEYEATARVLVTPLPSGDRSLIGLPLPRALGEPSRSVETAARLIEGAANARLAGGADADFRLSAVSVEPQEESNVVEVVGTASSASRAADIANAYVTAALAERERRLRSLAQTAIATSRDELDATTDPLRIEILQNRLVDLSLLAEGGDPTLSVAQEAVPPRSAAGAARSVVLTIAAVAGFALGSVAALLIELLVPRRLRDEADVLRAYPLPVLTRVPRPQLRRAGDALSEDRPDLAEAFRALRSQLDARDPGAAVDARRADGGGAAVAILSGTRSDDSALVSAGLAQAIGRRGERALVIDLDPDGPSIAMQLGIENPDAFDPLTIDASFETLSSVGAGPQVQVIEASAAIDPEADERLFVVAAELVGRARQAADWVLVATPPIGERSDVLAVARACDRLVIVSRLGQAEADALTSLREIFEAAGRAPTGHVLTGVGRVRRRAAPSAPGSIRATAERQPAES